MNLAEHFRIRDKGTKIEKLEHSLQKTEESLYMLWDMYNRLRDDWNLVFRLIPHRWELRDREERGDSREPEGQE